MSTGEIREAGFYGKLPSYGDFIQKRLPNDFTNPWHEWLQQGLMAIRESDPSGWKSFYLNCPAWCFVLDAGMCGEQAMAGVTIPSVDRVGRYFNFTMAVALPENTAPALFAANHSDWFDTMTQLVITILDQEMDQDQIEQAMMEQATELQFQPAMAGQFEENDEVIRITDETAKPVSNRFAGLAHHHLSIRSDRYGLWWHAGSNQVSPQLVCIRELPSVEVYLKLMRSEELAMEAMAATTSATDMDFVDELIGNPADDHDDALDTEATETVTAELTNEPIAGDMGDESDLGSLLNERIVPEQIQGVNEYTDHAESGSAGIASDDFDDDDDFLEELLENSVTFDDEDLPGQ